MIILLGFGWVEIMIFKIYILSFFFTANEWLVLVTEPNDRISKLQIRIINYSTEIQ